MAPSSAGVTTTDPFGDEALDESFSTFSRGYDDGERDGIACEIKRRFAPGDDADTEVDYDEGYDAGFLEGSVDCKRRLYDRGYGHAEEDAAVGCDTEASFKPPAVPNAHPTEGFQAAYEDGYSDGKRDAGCTE